MTSDPTRYLADVGCRLLRTARPFLEVPVPLRLPDAYNDALLDPVTALSGVCDGLLGPYAPPDQTQHGGAHTGMVTTPLPRPGTRGAAATPAPGFPRYVPHTKAWDGASRTPRSHAGPPGSGASPTPVRRGAEIAVASSPDTLGSRVGSAPTPHKFPDASALRQDDIVLADGGEERYPVRLGHDPRSAEREGRMPAAPSPAERPFASGRQPVPIGEQSPDAGGAAYPSTRQAPHENQWEGVPGAPRRIGGDPAREEPERDVPGMPRYGAVRLASDSGRLAAMLRAHAAYPAGIPRGSEAVPFPPVDEHDEAYDPVGGADGTGADGRTGVEEVLERLADELDTEYVRTYGSSGV